MYRLGQTKSWPEKKHLGPIFSQEVVFLIYNFIIEVHNEFSITNVTIWFVNKKYDQELETVRRTS